MKKYRSLLTTPIIIILLLQSVSVEAFSSHQHASRRPLQSFQNIKSTSPTKLYVGRKTDEDEVVGYVPSGLTAKQYAKIKKEELDKKKKMDFGAWGPRFAKSGRPDGDWMVVPSLWTNGFSSNAEYSNRSTSTSNVNNQNGTNLVVNFMNFMRKVMPVYMVSLFIIEMIVASFFKTSSSLIAVIGSRIMEMDLKSAILSSLGGSIVKITLAKIIVASLLIKPYSMFIERCNRRCLWSPRRTMTLSSITSSAVLLISILLRRSI